MPGYNRDQQQSEFWKLKINKETETPYFYRVENKNDAWVETEACTGIKGQLSAINLKTYMWENKEKQSMEIVLIHETGVKMIVTTSFSNMSRSLLNSLAGCDSIGVIDMQAARWGKKGEDKKYPTLFVQNNGQKTQWKYQMNEIPAVESIKNKKGEVVSIDDTDANEFFKLIITNEILPKIHAPQQVQSEMTQRTAPQNIPEKKGYTSELAPDSSEIKDDLPF